MCLLIIADSAQMSASEYAQPRVVYGADCKLQNNREKRSFSATKASCQHLQNLKRRKTGEKYTGMSYFVYKREMKAANSKHTHTQWHTHTHTQSEYCNCSCACAPSVNNIKAELEHQLEPTLHLSTQCNII